MSAQGLDQTGLRRRALLRGTALACAAGLSGCSVLPERPYEEHHDFPLVIPPPATATAGATATAARGGKVLLVRLLRAGPGLDARGLRSIRLNGTEDISFWDEWAVPPPQAVEGAIRAWLAASGDFSAVISPGSDATPDYVLEGELTVLEADERTHLARAVTTIVVLRHGAVSTPVLQRVCEGTAPLAGPSGADNAAAMLAAATAMLARIQAVVTQAV